MFKKAKYPRHRQAPERDNEVVKPILQAVEMFHLGLQDTACNVIGCKKWQKHISQPVESVHERSGVAICAGGC
jgi:hypothetical protein